MLTTDRKPYFHGADQMQSDMQESPAEKERNGEADQGDGLHHHQIDEDEGGGFHSVHTHPDGHQEHADHATYDEASDHMDANFGHGESDGNEDDGSEDGGGDDDSMDSGDIAGDYGRRANCG